MNAQQALADTEVTGTAGGGLVKATVNGQGELLDLSIQPAAVDADDADETARTIADLVLAAVRDAYRAAEDLQQQQMGPFAAAMQGGGMPGMPGAGGLDLPRRPRPVRPRSRRPRPADPAERARTARILTTRTTGDAEGPDVYEGVVQNLIDELGRLPGRRSQGRPADRLSPAGRRSGRRQAARRRADRGDRAGPVLPDLRQRGRGRGVPDLPGPAPRPVGDLRGRGAQGRRGDREDPRVPRPLPRARRSDQPDRRDRPGRPADQGADGAAHRRQR